MSDLISAAKNGYHDNLENLLSTGTPIESRDKDEATALYWGACRGHVKICDTLLKSGCDIDAQVKWGSSALHAAADRGHLNCLTILISWGADLNLQNNRGDTALHLAAYRGYADIVDALIAAQADPYVKNETGKTAILEAQSQSHSLAAFKLQQYMDDLQGFSSSLVTPSDISYMKTIQSSPSSWPQHTNIPFTPNIQNPNTQVQTRVNNLSNPSTVFTQAYPPQSYHTTKNPSSLSSAGGVPRRTIEPQESSDSLDKESPVKVRKGSSLNLLQHPVHEFSSLEHVQNSGRDILHANDSLPMRQVRNSGHVTLMRKHSTPEGSREVLENLAESLQLELVKYSERVMGLEHGATELRNKLLQMEQMNKELLWQQDVRNKELQNTKDLLSKERRKNFEVSKQQILLSRSMSSVSSPSRTTPRAPRHQLSHKHFLNWILLEVTGKSPCNTSIDFQGLQKQIQSVWLRRATPVKFDTDREWVPGEDYTLVGDGPLNHLQDGVRSGACSLVFNIRKSGTSYILKMMINLINLEFSQHDQGCSLDGFLIKNFGPEYHVPLLLAQHPNIVNVVHYFQGSTQHFQRFKSLLIPPNLDVPLEMASRTSFLVLESYPQTLLSFMVNQRTVCPEPCYGLPNDFLLLLLYQLLNVIDYLQCNHIVHRDIKGDNVFLDKCLRPVLADFGFARSLHTPDGRSQIFMDRSQSCAGNSQAWAPELTRFHHCEPESLPAQTSLQEVYAKSDGYAVSRMFYSLLRPLGDYDDFPESSMNRPHYDNASLPSLPPGFSLGLCQVLRDLVLNNPRDRPTTKQALIRVGVMLFAPNPGEIGCESDVPLYLTARALKLLAIHREDGESSKVLTMDESLARVLPEVEADLLVRVTPGEFWQEYQHLHTHKLIPTT